MHGSCESSVTHGPVIEMSVNIECAKAKQSNHSYRTKHSRANSFTKYPQNQMSYTSKDAQLTYLSFEPINHTFLWWFIVKSVFICGNRFIVFTNQRTRKWECSVGNLVLISTAPFSNMLWTLRGIRTSVGPDKRDWSVSTFVEIWTLITIILELNRDYSSPPFFPFTLLFLFRRERKSEREKGDDG